MKSIYKFENTKKRNNLDRLIRDIISTKLQDLGYDVYTVELTEDNKKIFNVFSPCFILYEGSTQIVRIKPKVSFQELLEIIKTYEKVSDED